jgi:hypothetical protein
MSIVTAAAFAITHAASARAGYFGSRVYPLAPPSAPVGVKPPCTLPTHRRRGTGTILVCFPKRAHICASLTFAVHPQPLPVCASMPVEVPQPGLASKPKRANRSPGLSAGGGTKRAPTPTLPSPRGAGCVSRSLRHSNRRACGVLTRRVPGLWSSRPVQAN